jgi:transcriptional regulator with XRE-family HTH domain
VVRFAGSQARAIGAEIRKHRESLNRTLEQVSALTGISRSTLSRIETGVRKPTVDEVASVLTALNVIGPGKERLVRLTADGPYAWVGIGAGIAAQLSAVSTYEAEATSISTLQISVFPGLLQTSEYARVLISTSPLGSAERERAVFTRVGRQSVLTRPGLKSYRAFIDEAAFQRKVGGSEIMTKQLRHLIQVGQQAGKSIRVLPFEAGAYWGCEGAFTLYKFGDDHCAVFQENQGSGVFIDDNKDTEGYEKVLDNLDNIALNTVESEQLITDYLKRSDT